MATSDESEDRKSLEWRDIGGRIRDARKGQKLTQAQLGSLVGTVKSDIAALEGGRAVSEEKLERLATALGLSRPYLRYGIASGADAEHARRMGYIEGRRDMLHLLRGEIDSILSRIADDDSDSAESSDPPPDSLVDDLASLVDEGADEDRILARLAGEDDPMASLTDSSTQLESDTAVTPRKRRRK